jgi:transcriptional regulator with XRE-family HTH domain
MLPIMVTDFSKPRRHYLREWRIHRGLNQLELAVLAGTTKWMICRFETGARHMKFEMQFRLMDALKIEPGQFFSSPETTSLDALIADKTPEERERIVNLVKFLLAQEAGK